MTLIPPPRPAPRPPRIRVRVPGDLRLPGYRVSPLPLELQHPSEMLQPYPERNGLRINQELREKVKQRVVRADLAMEFIVRVFNELIATYQLRDSLLRGIDHAQNVADAAFVDFMRAGYPALVKRFPLFFMPTKPRQMTLKTFVRSRRPGSLPAMVYPPIDLRRPEDVNIPPRPRPGPPPAGQQ